MTSDVAVIRSAAGAADMTTARELFLDYAASLNFSLCFQGFDQEVATLPGAYAPPRGGILLAEESGRAVGVAAFRPLKADICEMKRLYVCPDARGTGAGKRLAAAITVAARQAGYRAMRLDTHESMTAAMSLYRSPGFIEISAYYDNPLDGIHYFARVPR